MSEQELLHKKRQAFAAAYMHILEILKKEMEKDSDLCHPGIFDLDFMVFSGSVEYERMRLGMNTHIGLTIVCQLIRHCDDIHFHKCPTDLECCCKKEQRDQTKI